MEGIYFQECPSQRAKSDDHMINAAHTNAPMEASKKMIMKMLRSSSD
jgi:hypothetical protein